MGSLVHFRTLILSRVFGAKDLRLRLASPAASIGSSKLRDITPYCFHRETLFEINVKSFAIIMPTQNHHTVPPASSAYSVRIPRPLDSSSTRTDAGKSTR